MSTMTMPAEIEGRFRDSRGVMELRGEAGALLGRFMPEAEYQRILYRLAETSCPYTKEQMEAFQNKPGGSSLADFWNRMESKR